MNLKLKLVTEIVTDLALPDLETDFVAEFVTDFVTNFITCKHVRSQNRSLIYIAIEKKIRMKKLM